MKIKDGSIAEIIWGFSRVAIGLLPLLFIALYFNWLYIVSYFVMGVITFIFTKANNRVSVFFLMLLFWPIILLLCPEFKKKAKSAKTNDLVDKIVAAVNRDIELDKQIEKMCESGTDQDVIPWGIGEFGLAATNPIPVHKKYGVWAYTKRLRPLEGSDFILIDERPGSAHAPNIKHPIDAYVFSLNGKDLITLYFSIYHRKNSNKAPKGFKLGDLKPPKPRQSCIRRSNL